MVAEVKIVTWREVEVELERPGEEKELLKMTKARNKASVGFTKINQENNSKGRVIENENNTKKRR